MNSSDKSASLAKICTINAVEGFDPAPLAVEYTDMNAREIRLRLPVMAQVAWFRLKYPEGRFTFDVKAESGIFVAKARVYAHYNLPVEQYLSEATAARAYLPEKPSVSPREWAQTAALGIALRNAGFGLQFHAAGESFDEPAVNEFDGPAGQPYPAACTETEPDAPETRISGFEKTDDNPRAGGTAPDIICEDPLESAMKKLCPISKYKGKTLGDMVSLDPGALVWLAGKYTGDRSLTAAAKLICDHSLASVS